MALDRSLSFILKILIYVYKGNLSLPLGTYFRKIKFVYYAILVEGHLITISAKYLGLDTRKPVFVGLRTTKTQTSWHICAV